METKKTGVAKANLRKKNGAGGIRLPDFRVYYKAIVIKADWFDLLAVQGTLKSFLQHYSSKASILRCSAFFMVQLSYPYMTTGKTIALPIRNFVTK